MDVEEAAGKMVPAAAVKKQHVKELAANEYARTAPLTTPVEQCLDWARELPDLIVEEAAGEVVAAAAAKKQDVKELAANEYAYTAPLTTPVEQCFDWARELPDLIATSTGTRLEFYIVVFRSIRKSSANSDQLYSADAAAHDEARLSGGLLKYWYGTLNERRECLAMCIWASREEAVKAVHKPAHREAMKLAPVMYEMYTLERYALRIDQLRPSFTLLGSMSST